MIQKHMQVPWTITAPSPTTLLLGKANLFILRPCQGTKNSTSEVRTFTMFFNVYNYLAVQYYLACFPYRGGTRVVL